MISIIALMVAIAITLIVASQLMAAQATQLTVPTNVIFISGKDPLIIHLTAGAAVTPGDNMKYHTDNDRCQPCAAGNVQYLGTADKNDNARLDGNNPMTHDFATGELVPIITGNCYVRKVADTAVANRGVMQRVGSTDGGECQDIGTAANGYVIGRAITKGVAAGAFVMHQI